VPKAIVPTLPGKIESAGVGRAEVTAWGGVGWSRVSEMPVTVAAGNTVRVPPGPSAKLGAGAAEARIWARIFWEIGVMLCVVKRLSAAISLGFAPPTMAPGSASRSALRYAFCSSLFVCP
jgi:hypothetical protein